MKPFRSYAYYYDLLYQDKSYADEAEFVDSLITKYNPNSYHVLDLGCGSGRHAAELFRKGYSVTGLDQSSEMLALAQERKARLLNTSKENTINFFQADITSFTMDSSFDTALALFHVVSYLDSYYKLDACFRNVYNVLNSGGTFIFDFWYGPAVLSDKPGVRHKGFENSQYKIKRTSKPHLNVNQNTVDVHFTLQVKDLNNCDNIDVIDETHTMRYWFKPELEYFLEKNNFKMLVANDWMADTAISGNSWNGFMIAKKNV